MNQAQDLELQVLVTLVTQPQVHINPIHQLDHPMEQQEQLEVHQAMQVAVVQHMVLQVVLDYHHLVPTEDQI